MPSQIDVHETMLALVETNPQQFFKRSLIILRFLALFLATASGMHIEHSSSLTTEQEALVDAWGHFVEDCDALKNFHDVDVTVRLAASPLSAKNTKNLTMSSFTARLLRKSATHSLCP